MVDSVSSEARVHERAEVKRANETQVAQRNESRALEEKEKAAKKVNELTPEQQVNKRKEKG